MSEAMRYNDGKPKLSYFMRSFPRMAEAIARVKEMGGIKYEEGNWKKGNKPDEEYWDSMFRHLNYIFTGEEYDKDTGCLHIAHAVWNMCALHELNSDAPPIDEELFQERALHWAKVRAEREAKEAAEKEAKVQAAFAGIFVSGEKLADIEKWDATFTPGRHYPPEGGPGFIYPELPDVEKTEAKIDMVNASLTCQGFCPDCTCDDCCDPDAGLGAGPEITLKPGVPSPLLPAVSKTCDMMFEMKDDGKTDSFKALEKKLLDRQAQQFAADAEAMAVEVAIAQVTKDSKARVEKAQEEADKTAKAEYIAQVNADVKLLADALRKANDMGMPCLTQEEMNKAMATMSDGLREANKAARAEAEAKAAMLWTDEDDT